MKKNLLVAGFSLILLLISSLVAYFLKFACIDDAWVPLIFGIGILAFSGIIAFVAKYLYVLNYFAFVLSGIALGLCIRSWYIYRGFENNIWIMIGVAVISSLYILVYYLYSRIPIFEKHPLLFTLIYLVITLTGYILLVINTNTTFISTYGYYMIIEVAFLFASLCHEDSKRKLFRNIVLSTYSVLIVAIIMAVIMLAGDGIDFDVSGFDIGLDFPKRKKKK